MLPQNPRAFGLGLSNPINVSGLEERARCFVFFSLYRQGTWGHVDKDYELFCPAKQITISID